jgi:hypothetical protein
MQLWSAGSCPASVRVGALHRPAALLRTLIPALATLALGACSAAGPVTQSANLYSAQASPPRSYLTQIEGDGLESQRPPRLRAPDDAAPDDPTEPFSPNYGSVPLRAPIEPETRA